MTCPRKGKKVGPPGPPPRVLRDLVAEHEAHARPGDVVGVPEEHQHHESRHKVGERVDAVGPPQPPDRQELL